MDDSWQQLPRAAVLVYVGVLAAGASRTAQAEQVLEPAAEPSAEVTVNQGPVAPTCGPECHTPGYDEPKVIEPPPDPERLPEAPTCGPECHNGEPPYMPPPPVAPSKKGCSIGDEPNGDAAPMALGLGLLAGAAAVRRRGRERP